MYTYKNRTEHPKCVRQMIVEKHHRGRKTGQHDIDANHFLIPCNFLSTNGAAGTAVQPCGDAFPMEKVSTVENPPFFVNLIHADHALLHARFVYGCKFFASSSVEWEVTSSPSSRV